ncbi:unnamed protein product [Fusarium graminearum]|uniref:NmrA-like domain-containing protein n=1 Tax=Gibberella zeae TaxID=5518 RepID=A0A9N8RQB1_GIBZA|nr:unnamed protein product [Fusarium graminearum]
MSRAILITGATGKQGGAVINALLAKSSSEFLLLAVTRNKESASAKNLAAKSSNIKLVEGDLDSIPALFQAAKRAAGTVPIWGVYSVQLSMGKGVTLEGEVRQGKGPTAFMENLEPIFATKIFLTMIRDTLKDKPLQWVAIEDIGYFAAEAFTDTRGWNKKAISITGDELTFAQLSEAFEHATGGPAGTTFGILGKALKVGVKELGIMVNWFRDEGYGADLAKVRQLNPEAKTMEQWVKTSAFVSH